MKENFQNELKSAILDAQKDEVLNEEEMNATEGGSNISLGNCGDTNVNCVPGCSCTLKPITGSGSLDTGASDGNVQP